ncbi:hypothetical protein V8C26DRAFT_313340 [Trichoderma gracile]
MDPEAIEIDSTASESESSASGYDDPEVEYEEWKEDLLACLDSIKSSGDYVVFKKYPLHANPCLQIEGQETVIPLPLTDHDAGTIRGACREAPFGKGDETLVDTSVRKTWELDATRFKCTNPSWPAFFDSILKDVATGFGLPGVTAKPHKLLLYEKGSFFKRHKDSEKEAGMVATLVVCLPGAHKGGDVHLSFGSEKRELATAPASRFDVTALAWFSDVDHEVKPLESGNRLVLTYKLFQPSGIVQSAQLLFGQSQRVKSILSKWQTRFPDRFMLAYPLDHLYTKSSLSMNNLKGRDRAVCHSLQEVSAACGLYLTLGHMTRSEMDDGGGYFASEEPSTRLETVFSCDGAPIGWFCQVDESEILVPDFFEDRDPDSEDEGEFTGNENMPAAFRYHNTVAVLTPMHQLPHYLSNSISKPGGAEADSLLSMVKKVYEQHREKPIVKSNTLKVMTDILGASQSSSSSIHFNIARWALETDHEELFQKALRTLLNPKLHKDLLAVLPEYACYLLDRAYGKRPRTFDWDSIIGPFMQSTPLGAWDSISKKLTAHFETEAVKNSFSLWAKPQLNAKLNAQASFDVNDHDFFLESLDRFTEHDRILTAFSSRGTRELIFKVLQSLYLNQERYGKDKLKRIFETTLEAAASRLALRTQDLKWQSPYVYYSSFRPAGHDSSPLFRQFTTLIEQTIAVGVSDQAILLVEESHNKLKGASSWLDPSGCHKEILARELLAPLASTFHSCQIPPTPGVKAFFELLIRDVLHPGMPKYPERMRGWRHKRRGCQSCKDCASLDAFLESEDENSWSLRARADIRKHLESRLPSSIFRKSTITDRAPHMLIVEKLGTEHEEEVKTFRQQLSAVDSVLAPLRGEIFRGLLGDVTYQELVELQGIRAPATQGPVAGVKRSSESNLAGDSVRQRM